jgi:outer membrane immunogenic protein
MKKLLLASTMLVAISAAANAADLRTSPAAIPAVAPMAVGNWGGFYVGAHAGWLGSNHVTRVDGLAGGALVAGTDAFSASYTRSGFNGGLYAGFNFQMQQLVLGVEADVGFGPGSSVTSPSLNFLNAAGGNIGGTRDGLNWNGHLRARAGWALGQFMPYVAVGLALAEQRLGNVITVGSTPTSATLFGPRTISRTGYSLGVGGEFMFTRNILGRIEYIFDDYGTNTGGLGAFDANVFGAGATGNVRSRLTTNTVRAGLAYKF